MDKKPSLSASRITVLEPGYIAPTSQKKLSPSFMLKTREGVGFDYIDEGTSQDALLMLPPYGVSTVCFRSIIGPLSKYYRVVVPSYPIFGTQSGGGVPFDYTPSKAAQALEHLLTALGISRLRVIAVGEGAAILFKLCDITALTVISAVVVSPGSVNEYYPADIRSAARGGFVALHTAPSPRKIERFLRDAYFDQTLITPALIDHYCELYSSASARRAFSEALAQYDSEPMKLFPQEDISIEDEDDPVARSLSMRAARRVLPLMIIYGEMDRWHKPDQCPIAAVYKSAQIVIMRNSAAVPYIEKPEQFVRRVISFLE